MELRTPWAPPTPVLTADGSEKELLGKWHEPQETVPSALKFGSQNKYRPSSTPSTVMGLSAGMSIGGKKAGISSSYGVASG